MLLKSDPTLPSGSKIDLSSLTEIPRLELPETGTLRHDPSLYYFEHQGFHFDFLWHPKKDADMLFVLFSGDALRQKLDPPVFQRWKWARLFPGHCLYVSDPSLHLYERLGLAWYAGTTSFDPAPVIADTVTRVARQFGIDAQKVWTYGSSGGGFAALRMLKFLPAAKAICVNPQTNVLAYGAGTVEVFLRVCFERRTRDEALEEFSHRLSLLSQPDIYKSRSIIYLQNGADLHHFDDHYVPFCKALGLEPVLAEPLGTREHRTGNFHTIHFH